MKTIIITPHVVQPAHPYGFANAATRTRKSGVRQAISRLHCFDTVLIAWAMESMTPSMLSSLPFRMALPKLQPDPASQASVVQPAIYIA